MQRAAVREGEDAARDLAISIAGIRNRGDSSSEQARHRAADTTLAMAVLSELQTRVRNLEDAVAMSRLSSPLAGLVIGVDAEVGVQWNTRDTRAAFEIVDPASYVVRVSVPSARARRFEAGEAAWVELPKHVRADRRTLPASMESVSSIDVPITERAVTTMWREVRFKLPSEVPQDLITGDEIRVAFAP